MSILTLQNIQIEEKIFINTIIDLMNKDNYIKDKVKSSIFDNAELVDLRTLKEKKRTE